MAKSKSTTSKPAPAEKRKKGPIVCEPDSDIARRIEKTHHFGSIADVQKKRLAEEAEKRKGDSK